MLADGVPESSPEQNMKVLVKHSGGGKRIGSKIKDQLIQIPVKTYYDLSLVRSRLVNDFSLTGLDSELSMSDTGGSQHLKDGTSKYIYDTSL